MFVNFTAFIR